MSSRSLARRGIAATAALALGAATVAAVAGQAAAADTPAHRVRVQSAPAWTASAHRLGTAPAASVVAASAVLPLRDPAGAEALATAVATPARSSTTTT